MAATSADRSRCISLEQQAALLEDGGAIALTRMLDAAQAGASSSDRAGRAMTRQRQQIARDIDALMPAEINDTTKLRLLLSLSQGARTVFDQRTHRQVKQVYNRFNYVFYEAQLLENSEAEDLVEDVIEHLEEAEAALQTAWGQGEFARLNQNAERLADFGPAARVAFGEERLNEPVASLGESEADVQFESNIPEPSTTS